MFELIDLDNPKPVQLPTNTPNKTANAIYTALNAASKLPITHEYFKYNLIREKYLVKVKSTHILITPRINYDFSNAVVLLAESKIKENNNLVLDTLTTVFEIVGACIRHDTSLTFPNAALSAEAFTQLKKWADKNDYSFNEGVPLIMTKNVPREEASSVE